jgi:hypothetical protein
MIFVNYLDGLMRDKDDDGIIKLKWYCCVSFGFLNKGKQVGEQFEVIIKFLKKCIDRKYSVIDNEKMKLTKTACGYLE